MTHYVAITAVGADRPGLVETLARAVFDAGCNIEESRMSVLGDQFAVILLASGAWNTIAKLEAQMPALEQRTGLKLVTKRTDRSAPRERLLPYAVDVIAADHPGIVYNLTSFFAGREINIQELITNSYYAAHTGTPMFSVHMTLQIPAEMHIASLRDEFMDLCDQLNLDAVMEPVKS
ncbi:MAG: glycine cleavage system protein R [Gammaproteobacteria bacterium]|nr:glycine cleavage system protein R [Gammaproteobacteria bacterium]